MAERSKTSQSALPAGYAPLLADLKERVRVAQTRAVLSVNRELIVLYWHIGGQVLRCQREEGWGAKVVDRLAKDLLAEFPETEGFSPRNLKYMRALALAYPEGAFVQQVVAQIPWGHNLLLLNKLKQHELREWYARKTFEHGWSRAVLSTQIQTKAHVRAGKALPSVKDLENELR